MQEKNTKDIKSAKKKMSYRYILHEYAQEDYESSLKWYMERSVQAADNFTEAVDNALQLICDNPTRWHNTYKNYYELGLKKYPFTIIYIIEENEELIVVTAIYHHKRNPKKKGIEKYKVVYSLTAFYSGNARQNSAAIRYCIVMAYQGINLYTFECTGVHG